MKKLWEWIGRNSAALAGLATILSLVVGLMAVPRWFKPDLVLQINADANTTPPDLKKWMHDVADNLAKLASSLEARNESEKRLQEFAKSPITTRLRGLQYSLPFQGIHRFRIDIRNQTDHAISGVRVRIDGIAEIWDIQVEGSFLTNQETRSFVERMERSQRGITDADVMAFADEVKNAWSRQEQVASGGGTIVLPELPALPPNSNFGLIIYGLTFLRPEFTRADISAPGVSTKVERIVKIEETWLLPFYRNPGGFTIVLLVLVLSVVGGIGAGVYGLVKVFKLITGGRASSV